MPGKPLLLVVHPQRVCARSSLTLHKNIFLALNNLLDCLKINALYKLRKGVHGETQNDCPCSSGICFFFHVFGGRSQLQFATPLIGLILLKWKVCQTFTKFQTTFIGVPSLRLLKFCIILKPPTSGSERSLILVCLSPTAARLEEPGSHMNIFR